MKKIVGNISMEHFVEHKPLISEECHRVYFSTLLPISPALRPLLWQIITSNNFFHIQIINSNNGSKGTTSCCSIGHKNEILFPYKKCCVKNSYWIQVINVLT